MIEIFYLIVCQIVFVAKLDLKDGKIRKALLKGLKKEQSKEVPKKSKEHLEFEVFRTIPMDGQKSLFPTV